jgi:hypothetical protein
MKEQTKREAEKICYDTVVVIITMGFCLFRDMQSRHSKRNNGKKRPMVL